MRTVFLKQRTADRRLGPGRRTIDSSNAAIVALTKIEDHIDVCDQRYETIDNNQQEIKQTVKELSGKIDKIDRKIIYAMATITAIMAAGKFVLDVLLGTPILSAIQKIHGG